MAWLKKRGGVWHLCWRENGRERARSTTLPDKRLAQQSLATFEARRHRGEVNCIDIFSGSRTKPLSDHLDDYVADLRAKGRSSSYIYRIRKRLDKLTDACDWKLWTDISADTFAVWRETPIADKHCLSDDRRIGPVTSNQYLEATRSFCTWMVRRGRMPSNPLAVLGKMDESADLRRQRRALREDQMHAVLAAAGDDALVYQFLLSTGLRRAEAAALVWSDLHLDALPSPYVQLRASTTKSKRADALPLRADLAQCLQDARGDAQDADRVFAQLPDMERHKAILAAAGVPYRDHDGRVADLHAMRHTYGTMLSKAGVPPRVAMELMRHTDMRLTMRIYTDPRVFDLAGAVEKLPAMTTPKAQAKKTAVP